MPEPSQTALDGADPIITRIVRMKLRASLRPDDYREHNLDALDLLGDIRLKLIRKLGEPGESVESFSSYAATVAYNTCSDYVRAKYPERARLRNAIRRLFEKSQQHALWQDSSGDLLCGFAGWRQLPPANGTQLAQARQEGQFDTSGSESLHTLLRLADQILDSLGAPLMLDELVSLVSHHSGL